MDALAATIFTVMSVMMSPLSSVQLINAQTNSACPALKIISSTVPAATKKLSAAINADSPVIMSFVLPSVMLALKVNATNAPI